MTRYPPGAIKLRTLLGVLWLGTAVVGTAAFGCGTGGRSAPGTEVDGGWSFALRAGGFVEANLVMAGGSSVAAPWTTTGATTHWDIHSHPSTGLTIHDEGDGTEGTIVFFAPAAGPYSLMWSRTSEATELVVDLQLTGEITVEWVVQ